MNLQSLKKDIHLCVGILFATMPHPFLTSQYLLCLTCCISIKRKKKSRLCSEKELISIVLARSSRKVFNALQLDSWVKLPSQQTTCFQSTWCPTFPECQDRHSLFQSCSENHPQGLRLKSFFWWRSIRDRTGTDDRQKKRHQKPSVTYEASVHVLHNICLRMRPPYPRAPYRCHMCWFGSSFLLIYFKAFQKRMQFLWDSGKSPYHVNGLQAPYYSIFSLSLK